MKEQRTSKLPNELAEIERIRYFNPKKYVEYSPKPYDENVYKDFMHTSYQPREKYVE